MIDMMSRRDRWHSRRIDPRIVFHTNDSNGGPRRAYSDTGFYRNGGNRFNCHPFFHWNGQWNGQRLPGWLMPIGNALTIAFRLIANMGDIQALVPRIVGVSNDVQRLLPQLTAAINDGQRVLTEAHELLAKIAPELLPPQAAMIEPVYDVRWLQTSLNVLMDAQLTVDGEMGPPTIEAIKHFQTVYDLTVDGWAGVITQAAIYQALQRRTSLT